MLYATGPAGLATLVRGSSRRITIMRFRPANIRLINRRSNLPRLLLALSSKNGKCNNNDKNNPMSAPRLTGSLHIRAFPTNALTLIHPLELLDRLRSDVTSAFSPAIYLVTFVTTVNELLPGWASALAPVTAAVSRIVAPADVAKTLLKSRHRRLPFPAQSCWRF